MPRPRRSPLESHAVLGLLLATFVFVPLASLDPTMLSVGALRLMHQVVLLGTLITLARRRMLLWTGIALLAASTTARLALPPGDGDGWANLIGAGFLLLVLAASIRRLLTERHVDAGLISGALSVYLLFGLLWTLLYSALDWIQPGSFDGLVSNGPDEAVAQLHYFSYTTLTTLGYGDITPATPAARSLAVMEAFVGQIYLVVLVARLVAMHVARTWVDEPPGP